MDERKARRRQYFDRLADDWDAISPTEELERIGHLLEPFCGAPGEHVLDVGCGTGRLARFLLDRVAELGGVVGIDISLGMVECARRRIPDRRARFVQADAELLPFSEGSFAVVICFAAFPHLDAKERALAEFHRVTRPRGRFILLHLMGRDEVNQFHRQLSQAVSSDLLPSIAEMRCMVGRAGYQNVTVENRPDLFLLCARRVP